MMIGYHVELYIAVQRVGNDIESDTAYDQTIFFVQSPVVRNIHSIRKILYTNHALLMDSRQIYIEIVDI